MMNLPFIIEKEIYSLINTGKFLYAKGYVEANGGNISARVNRDYIIIKKTGVRLDSLKPKDFLVVNILNNPPPKVSSDYFIHRHIYQNTDHKYVIHVHPKNIIALSLSQNSINPVTYDSEILLGDSVEIYDPPTHQDLVKIISKSSLSRGVIVEKGHGVYVAGDSIDFVINLIEVLDHIAYILLKSSK